MPALLQTTPTSRHLGEVIVGSSEDNGVELYGCFPPHVGDTSSSLSDLPVVSSSIEGKAITEVVAPVLQIMPKLQKFVGALLFLSQWII